MSAQTTARKSRASRAAGKAAEDQAAQQPQPEPEVTPEPQPEQPPEPQAQADPQPEPSQPTAQLSMSKYAYWLLRPQVTAPDGKVVGCEHRDGHGTVKSAMACARALASQLGLTIPAADAGWADGGPGELVPA